MVNREKTIHLARVALSGAMLYTAQVTLSFLPNIEIVTLLIVIFAKNFGKDGITACFIYVALNAVFAGVGLWWATYFVVWPLFALMAYKLRNIDSWLIWAVINGSFGLCFGTLFALPYAVVSPAYAFSYWIGGISYDIVHCIGNFLAALLLGKPIDAALKRIIKHKKSPDF